MTAARTGQVKFAIGEGCLGEALERPQDAFMDGYPGFTLSLSVTDTTENFSVLTMATPQSLCQKPIV